MLFARAITLFSLHATRRLSRHRPTTILSIYLLLALSFTVLSYFLTTTLILKPLATFLFSYQGLHSSTPSPFSTNLNLPSPPTHAIGATTTSPRQINYGSLPFRRPEADLLLSYLRPHHIYLEYGASGTTLTFPPLLNFSFAIEHDPHVCAGIESEMRAHESLTHKLRAFCAPVQPGHAGWGLTSRFEEGSYRAFSSYVDFPRNNLSHVAFDRVLINGRARVACALRILPQLHERSVVFFHDWFVRPAHYARVLVCYEEVARVVAHGPVVGYSDEPMGMVVLRPKKGCTGSGERAEVSVEKVNEIYDAYVEKEPSEAHANLEIAVGDGLLRTEEGGIEYYALAEELAVKSSQARILLDVMMIPFVVLTYLSLSAAFRGVFLDALSSAGPRSARLLAGDMRAAFTWRRETSTKSHGRLATQTQPKEVVVATGGKAE